MRDADTHLSSSEPALPHPTPGPCADRLLRPGSHTEDTSCFVLFCLLIRIPKEVTVSNIHQAICNIPFLDFLTNKHMGILHEDQ